MCPKKKGFSSVNKEVKIAIFVLNIFLVNRYNPKMLSDEKDTFTKCIIKSILLE